MIKFLLPLLLACLLLAARPAPPSAGVIGGADGPTAILITQSEAPAMTRITMDEARDLFLTPGDYIILDVRRPDEFAEGHIPGAVNIANETILDQPPAALPDKDALIYVYCRSGNRSRQAAAKLAAMGYTHIVEFGGILDWTGEIEK